MSNIQVVSRTCILSTANAAHVWGDRVSEKHEIARLKTRLQAQVKATNLSRKHKKETFERIVDTWPGLSR